MKKPETIVISNFGGRLTRILNGELNSGFAKFNSSFGYDPFSKPMNLTWLEKPTDISAGTSDLILAAKPRFESDIQYVYAVGSAGKIYKIQPSAISNPNVDSVIAVGSVAANSPSFSFGASLDFFGATEKIYVGSNGQVNSIDFDFGGDAKVGTTGYVSNVFRPIKPFIGKLYFGNGATIGAIDSTGTVTSSIISVNGSNVYSELNPALGREEKITDIDSSVDGNYLLLTSSRIANENIATVSSDRQAGSASDGTVFRWNGTDATITAFNTIPSYAVTALQTYLQNNIFFSNDSFGSSLNDGVKKLITLQNNKAPFANATLVNGNFVSWIVPEVSADGEDMYASLYYFGSLDGETPAGLYRIMRHTTALSNGFVYQTPVNILTNNKYQTVNNAVSSIVTFGYGKHYFSAFEVNSSNTTVSTTTAKLYRFLVTSSGSGTPQLGVYETQTQLFSKRIDVQQIRVYTEPVVAGNGFQLDMIGSDGNVLTNGTYTYTFGDPVDGNERINFNPTATTGYALGIRITNTGTTNMTIKKIEVDWDTKGK